MSSPPGKFKCSAPEWFSCPEGITLNSGLTGPNNTYIYIQFPIFRKGRRKNSFKFYLSFRRVYFSGCFLLRASGISLESAGSAFLLTTVQRFCSRLFTGHSFPGAWLTWRPSLANVCPVLKILFAGEGPGVLANKSAHLFMPTFVLKLKILF